MNLTASKLNSQKLTDYLAKLETSNPKKYRVNISSSSKKQYFHSLDSTARNKTLQETSLVNGLFSNFNLAVDRFKRLYAKLLGFYQTNENKLISIVKKQVYNKTYFYSRQLIEFIKNLRQGKDTPLRCNYQKFIHDINTLVQFLEEFYQKKCIKQIDIIEESIVERQLCVRNTTDYNTYKEIKKILRPALLGDYNIYDEFKSISDKFGNFREISSVHRALYQRMYETEKKVANIFQSACNSKEKDRFHLKRGVRTPGNY